MSHLVAARACVQGWGVSTHKPLQLEAYKHGGNLKPWGCIIGWGYKAGPISGQVSWTLTSLSYFLPLLPPSSLFSFPLSILLLLPLPSPSLPLPSPPPLSLSPSPSSSFSISPSPPPLLPPPLHTQGQNIILNMNDHGFVVCAYNRTTEKVDRFLENEAKGRSYD